MPVKWTQTFLSGAVLLLALSMAGCSTQARRVDCDGKLHPINRPAPPAAPSMPPKKPQSSDGKP